ncbi:DUF6048 family protein [Formosa algae]|uniref:DUF6048 family protein n=1 Tax=Formosa algae TaxID=225843 RepID=UPI000CCE6D60|nr:DUF6048 family protein [Formosa algae]PNW26582.1 hypothetical protein BKP44_16370 [Formosa algae]
MKLNNILNFIISTSFCFFLFSTTLTAQNDSIKQATIDSIKIKEKYGLRVGLELSKLARTAFEDDYEGFEVMGDYRISKNLYIAGAFGAENNNTNTDYYDVTTKGTYFKAGIDYNAYQNWLDMKNMIYSGFRVGASTFDHTINSYTIYTEDQYWAPQFTSSESQDFDGLTAVWLELIAGFKVEIVNNLYIGAHVELKTLVSQKEPDNFENLYIPGFYKTYDSLDIGFGYGYSITYLIPLYKKDK